MRPLYVFTFTDTKQRQGDFIRMENILKHLRQACEVRVVRLPGYHEESCKRFGIYAYFAIKEIARLLLAFRALATPRRAIIYTWDWPLARNLALLTYLRRINYVMEVNGLHSFESELRGYFRCGSFLHRHYICGGERIAIHRAARVVAVSEGLRCYLVEQYQAPQDKCIVAENGADLARFPFSPAGAPSAGQPLVIGWAGSFQPYEGFETLIDLAAALSLDGLRLHFLIVGDGPSRLRHEAAVRAKGLEAAFTFVGRIPWEEVPKALAPAHCCIMVPDLSPAGRAYREALGVTQMKTYEYLAMGKPVVTYRLGDAKAVIDDNGVGITCAPDQSELAKTIAAMATADLASMARNARALAERAYTWKHTAQKILDGLAELGG